MGNKTSPVAFRIPTLVPWRSRWFERNHRYAELLREDHALRRFLLRHLKNAGVERVEIERSPRALTISVFTSRPGVVIGRGGEEIERLQASIIRLLVKNRGVKSPKELPRLKLDVQEVRTPGTSAPLVAQRMAQEIEKRMPFRRVLKQTVDRVSQDRGVEGVKVQVAGRLNGAEMSRSQWLAKGRLPLANLRADIDFAKATARCSYGTVGVKVWIYKGEKFQ